MIYLYVIEHDIDMADIDLVQPWRKSFPLAKPPIPGDKADAARFALEFEEGLDAEDAGWAGPEARRCRLGGPRRRPGSGCSSASRGRRSSRGARTT